MYVIQTPTKTNLSNVKLKTLGWINTQVKRNSNRAWDTRASHISERVSKYKDQWKDFYDTISRQAWHGQDSRTSLESTLKHLRRDNLSPSLRDTLTEVLVSFHDICLAVRELNCPEQNVVTALLGFILWRTKRCFEWPVRPAVFGWQIERVETLLTSQTQCGAGTG